jgi:hypothetical protein
MGTAIGTTTIALNVFQNTSPILFNGNADVRSTTPSLSYVGASGSRNIFLTNSIGRYFEISGINTSNYNNIQLSFGQYKSTIASNGTELKIEISCDGINYSQLFFTPRTTGTGTAIWSLITTTGQIPSCNNLRIKFTQTSTLPQFRIDDVKLVGYSCGVTTSTWTGTWSSSPTGNSIVIDSNYNTSINGNFEACSLTINPSATLTIANDNWVKVQNNITNNGSLIVQNNGSLIQVNDNGINLGDITYERTPTGLNGYDYVYWSSPVLNQSLSTFYTTPSQGFKFEWNPLQTNANGSNGFWVSPTTTTFTNAKGYIIRASSSYSWTGSLTARFIGNPNNGVVTTTVKKVNEPTVTDDRWNLIGNPYPSSINAISFLTYNSNLDGYVALWKHSNEPNNTATQPYYQSYQYNYSNDYVIYNSLGSSSGLGTFNGYIASGQGFFVNLLPTAPPSSNVTFNNSMRSEIYNNSQFYRTTNEEKSRIWLDLVDPNNKPVRMLFGYVNGASIDRDRLYDALTTNSNTNNIYSFINNETFIIQGKHPFDINDQIRIGYKTTIAGIQHIAISNLDGLFANYDIFLEDTELNIIHDLKVSPYSFFSEIGVFNDRFKIKYINTPLDSNIFNQNNVCVYYSNKKIYLNTNTDIKDVILFDVSGRLLYYGNYNNNNVVIFDYFNSDILLIKIITLDGLVYTKKLITK